MAADHTITVAVKLADADEVKALASDLALALRLLAEMFNQPLPTDWETRAMDLLDRYRDQQVCRDSSLLAWGAHLIESDQGQP